MLHTLRFFFSSKCRLFHNATFFGSCVIHILYTGCAKIKKKSGAKGLRGFITRLREWTTWMNGVVGAWHGKCESDTAALCKSNGKDTFQTLRGTAWQENGMDTACYVWIGLNDVQLENWRREDCTSFIQVNDNIFKRVPQKCTTLWK